MNNMKEVCQFFKKLSIFGIYLNIFALLIGIWKHDLFTSLICACGLWLSFRGYESWIKREEEFNAISNRGEKEGPKSGESS